MELANSTEFNKDCNCDVIIPVASEEVLGGTMRLGTMDIKLNEHDSIYSEKVIKKRFRHRYGFNKKYKNEFIFGHVDEKIVKIVNMKNEFKFLGETLDGMISNIEINGHMIGVQYHPEFQSGPDSSFIWLLK